MSLEKKILFFDNNTYFFECPHCDGMVFVDTKEVNCQIFRHAIMKSNGQQVNPHSSKEDCEMLSRENLVYGCCNPFRIILGEDSIPIFAEKCGWI